MREVSTERTASDSAEFGWKVAEYGGTNLRVHGVLFVLLLVALVK